MPGRWWWRGSPVSNEAQGFLQRLPMQLPEQCYMGHRGLTAHQTQQCQPQNRLKGVSDSQGLPRVRHLFQALEKGFRRRFHTLTTLTPHIRPFSLLFYPFYPDFAIVLD